MRKTTGLVAVVFVATTACKGSSTTALPPRECPDPCCGGRTSIDCAENPNVSCVEDADLCTARVYGCVKGSFYLRPPAQLPAGCDEVEGGADADRLVLGDGNVFVPDDASSAEVDAGASSDAPDETATDAGGGD